MLTFFILIFVLIILAAGITLTLYNRHLARTQLVEFSENNLESNCSRLEQLLNVPSKISFSLLANRQIQSALSKNQPDSENIAKIEDILYSTCFTSAARLSCYLYDYSGYWYYYDYENKKIPLDTNVKNIPLYEDIAAADGSLLYADSGSFFSNASGLSLFRIYKNIDTLAPLGILIINIDSSELNDALGAESDGQITDFLLSSQGTNLLNTQLNDEVATLIKDAPQDVKTHSVLQNAGNTLLCYKMLTNYPLLLGTIENFSTPTIPLYNTVLALIIILSILLLWVGIFIVSRSITTPIIELSTQMKNFSPRDFYPIPSDCSTSRETGLLINQFNTMGSEISQLLQKEVVAEKHRRHLELTLLQSQMKPHFLYNTLDHARILCLSGDTTNASNLLKSLGCYYKTILSKGKNTITITEEISIIKEFINILSSGNEIFFHISYEIDKSVKDLPILKFVLQPLVENCIKHGLFGLDDGVITIRFSSDDQDTLYASITDNGRGIPPQKIQDIIRESYHSKTGNGFGLSATLERLRLYYGENCSIKITDQNPGTQISFSIKHFSSYSGERSSQ